MNQGYPKCDSCIKSDVCNIRKDMAYAYDQIMTANTALEDGEIHYAKDNKNIDITVLCNKFSPRNGTALREKQREDKLDYHCSCPDVSI